MRLGFAGATIVRVVVDVAVLLVLFSHFRRDAHTALTAPQEAAVGARIILNVLSVASSSQNGICFVVEVFRYDRLVLALVYLAAIAEVSVVKGILQNERQARDMYSATASRKHARLFPKLGEIFETDFSRRVYLKSLFDELRVLPVYDNGLGERIVQISERSEARIDSELRLMFQSARSIRAQLSDVFRRHAKLDGHHQYVVVGIVASVVRLYVAEHAFLQKPLHLSAVHRIARQAVNLPTNNALCFALLNPL